MREFGMVVYRQIAGFLTTEDTVGTEKRKVVFGQQERAGW
jgi:hypothetical protein